MVGLLEARSLFAGTCELSGGPATVLSTATPKFSEERLNTGSPVNQVKGRGQAAPGSSNSLETLSRQTRRRKAGKSPFEECGNTLVPNLLDFFISGQPKCLHAGVYISTCTQADVLSSVYGCRKPLVLSQLVCPLLSQWLLPFLFRLLLPPEIVPACVFQRTSSWLPDTCYHP